MNSRQDAGWTRRARVAVGAGALAVVAVGCVGLVLGLRLDLGAVSIAGNASFAALGLAIAYAAATELTWASLGVDPVLFRPGRVGEVGFAFDFEDETV